MNEPDGREDIKASLIGPDWPTGVGGGTMRERGRDRKKERQSDAQVNRTG